MRDGKKNKIKNHRQSDLKMLFVGSLSGEIMDNLQVSKCSFHQSSQKLLFAAEEDRDRKLQLVNKQRRPDLGLPGPNSYIYNTTSASEAQRTLGRQDGAERF